MTQEDPEKRLAEWEASRHQQKQRARLVGVVGTLLNLGVGIGIWLLAGKPMNPNEPMSLLVPLFISMIVIVIITFISKSIQRGILMGTSAKEQAEGSQ